MLPTINMHIRKVIFMIKVENFSYSFPQKDLYQNISFTLEDNQHCAFIGTSGSGKSTLIDIIMDPERFMYDGTLEIVPGSRIGYVSQFSNVEKETNLTVFDYIAKQFHSLQKEIAERRILPADDYINKYGTFKPNW